MSLPSLKNPNRCAHLRHHLPHDAGGGGDDDDGAILSHDALVHLGGGGGGDLYLR